MKPIIFWTIKIAMLLVAVTGLTYVHYSITGLRREVAQQQSTLAEKPDQIFYEAALEAELSKHAFDITRINAYVPPREEIINVIATIEAEGQAHSAAVTIAEIKEKLVLDAANKPVPATGPVEDVIIELVAIGSPTNLMNFLHGLDHLPYVLHVESWHLSPDKSAQPPPTTSDVQAAPRQSRLEVTAVMVSRRLNYEANSTSN